MTAAAASPSIPARDPLLGRAGYDGPRARSLLELDEPFDEDDLLFHRFVRHLRARDVSEVFHAAFEAEARAFRLRFRHVATRELGAEHLRAHVEEGKRDGLTERALRNRSVAGQAFLAFLGTARPRVAPPPEPPPPPKEGASTTPLPLRDPRDQRRHGRVPFIVDVHVEHFGLHRSADISVGGIYLEKLTMVVLAMPLRLRFKLRARDPEPIVADAAVSFVHPQLGAGLRFVSMAPDDAERIAELVAREEARQSQSVRLT